MTITNSTSEEEKEPLTEEQAKEIFKRDNDLASEATFSKNWEIVKAELFKIYC